jgi:dihydrofolate reductase
MSSSVLLMSVSVDGFVAGPNDQPGNPGGDGFMRLHKWYERPDGEFGRPEGPAGDIWDELNATGAVLVGRRTAEQVDYYGGDHHGAPIFVLSRQPAPPAAQQYESVTFVTDIETAMAQAKEAAGDKRTQPGRPSRPVSWTSSNSTRSQFSSGAACDCSTSSRSRSNWTSSE